MRIILFTLVMFLSVQAQAVEVCVHVPEATVEEAARWFHYEAETRTESKAEYVTRKLLDFSTPIASFGRFKTPEEAGITWEVKE